jgi:hypothetical protein
MKNFKKLQFKAERLINDDELMKLKGGTETDPTTCCCVDTTLICCWGYLLSESGDCETDCREAFGPTAGGTNGLNCGPACPSCWD